MAATIVAKLQLLPSYILNIFQKAELAPPPPDDEFCCSSLYP